LHQALERVDAAKPDVDGAGAEVRNGGVVPVGDLPPFGDLELVVRCGDRQGSENKGAQGGYAG